MALFTFPKSTFLILGVSLIKNLSVDQRRGASARARARGIDAPLFSSIFLSEKTELVLSCQLALPPIPSAERSVGGNGEDDACCYTNIKSNIWGFSAR